MRQIYLRRILLLSIALFILLGFAGQTLTLQSGVTSGPQLAGPSSAAASAEGAPRNKLRAGPEKEEEGEPVEKPDPPRKPAEPVLHSVRGQVINKDGEAVRLFKAEFKGPKNGEAVNGTSGKFTFEGPKGAYTVTVTVAGKTQRFRVQISEQGLRPSTLKVDV